MDNMAYLNEIAATTRPTEPKKDNAFFSMIIKIGVIGVALLVVIIIIGVLIGGITGKEKTLSEQLSIRMTNLNTSITTYNRQVKSSALRALGVSLSGTLSNTNRDLTVYLQEEYEFDPSEVDTKIAEEETELVGTLNTSLETARLNGILDRTYSYQMEYQISLLLSLESEILARTSEERLQGIIKGSYESLEQIREQFEEQGKKID